MKRPALQNKQVIVLRMAFRAWKVLGTFEKRAPEVGGLSYNLVFRCTYELIVCNI